MAQSIQKIVKQLINNSHLSIILILFGMWVFRGLLLLNHAFPFNADEAIVGIMAKHILTGERPIFFYGQVYMGSLDAYLISVFFWLFGEKVVWIRVVQILLFSITIVEFYYWMQIVFENKFVSFISTLFFAFPVVNVVLYTTVSLGGYGEAFALGMAAMLISVFYVKTHMEQGKQEEEKPNIWLWLEGFVIGLGLWANALSLLFSIPAIFVLLWGAYHHFRMQELWKKITFVVFGFFVGASWWLYGLVMNGKILFSEMFGSAVSVENLPFLERTIQHFFSFLLFAPTVIFGFRPPWSVDWIVLPLIPFVILFWIITLRKIKNFHFSPYQKISFFAFIGTGLLVFLGFVMTSFGVDPSGRYFLPFVMLVSIFVGLAASVNPQDKIYFILLVLVLGYHIIGSVSYITQQPKITTQFFEPAQVRQEFMPDLMAFLMDQEEYYGYSNYWVSYPLAFLSDEQIIAAPKLPYHPDLKYTSRDSRILDYEHRVVKSDRVFYITTNNEVLDQVLESSFEKLAIEYKYHEIADYHIFYHLSEKIEPDQLVDYGLYR